MFNAQATKLAPAIDVTPAEPEEHKFSSTQVNLPEAPAKMVRDFAESIPDDLIAADGRAGDTQGTAPHVTVKYGLHTTDVDAIREVLAGEPPIAVTLGKTSLFTTDEADVLKVDVDSPDLHRLNAKIADALKTTDKFPDYKPHVTVAYLKPGKGKAYENDARFEGQSFTLDRLTFSTKDGEIFEIPLTARPINVLEARLKKAKDLDREKAQQRRTRFLATMKRSRLDGRTTPEAAVPQ